MAKKKKSSDINTLAFQIVTETTQQDQQESAKIPIKAKNPAAVGLGRLGGLKGGPARAIKLSSKKRQQIAQKAAQARWKKK